LFFLKTPNPIYVPLTLTTQIHSLSFPLPYWGPPFSDNRLFLYFVFCLLLRPIRPLEFQASSPVFSPRSPSDQAFLHSFEHSSYIECFSFSPQSAIRTLPSISMHHPPSPLPPLKKRGRCLSFIVRGASPGGSNTPVPPKFSPHDIWRFSL